MKYSIAILSSMAALATVPAQAQVTIDFQSGVDNQPTLVFATDIAADGSATANGTASSSDSAFDISGSTTLDPSAPSTIAFTIEAVSGFDSSDFSFTTAESVNQRSNGIGVNGNQGIGQTLLFTLSSFTSSDWVGSPQLTLGEFSLGAGDTTTTFDIHFDNGQSTISGVSPVTTSISFNDTPLSFGDQFALTLTAGVGPRINTLTFDVIPEPSTYAMIGGLLALTVVMLRRRK